MFNGRKKRPGVGSFVADTPTAPGGREQAQRPENRNKVLFIMMRNLNDVRNNSNAYNSQLFFTMERACRSGELSLFFLPILSAEELRPHIENDPPACALLVSHTPEEICQYLIDAHVPVIAVNTINWQAVSIMPDNPSGIALVMEHLEVLMWCASPSTLSGVNHAVSNPLCEVYVHG